MEDEPQGHNFDPSFKAKDPNKVRFGLLLWGEEQRYWSGGTVLRQTQAKTRLATPSTLTFPLSYRTPGHLPPVQVGSERAGGLMKCTEQGKLRGPAAEMGGCGVTPRTRLSP